MGEIHPPLLPHVSALFLLVKSYVVDCRVIVVTAIYTVVSFSSSVCKSGYEYSTLEMSKQEQQKDPFLPPSHNDKIVSYV